jgi:hypothetical protein
MPFEQLRALVLALVEADDDPANECEFEALPTTYAPNRPRVSTLDQLIASLPRRP